MSFQVRQSIASLSQSLYQQIQFLNPSDAESDSIQTHLDAVLSWSNDKTSSAVPDTVVSVDSERKKKRDKKDKDKDKSKNNVEPGASSTTNN